MPRIAHPLPRFRSRSTTPSARRPALERLPAGPRGCGAPPPPHREAALSLEIEWGGPAPVVVVAGELDLVGGELFTAVLDHVRSTRRGPVAVDLSGVTFVDTHGLTPAFGSDVVLVDASRVVDRLLALMGLPAVGAGRRAGGGRSRS